jgi:hypothetical protein
MYARWNLVLSLIVTFLCGQSNGLWPFTFHAAAEAPELEPLYPDSNAKRIAIIGMYFEVHQNLYVNVSISNWSSRSSCGPLFCGKWLVTGYVRRRPEYRSGTPL